MKNLLVLIALLLSFSAFGQQTGTIKGVLQDDNQETVEFATIVLRSTPDSAVVKTALSNETGAYELLNVAYGNYFVEVKYLGYADYFTPAFDFNTATYEVPQIVLSRGTTVLETAVVTSKRPLIERQLDRTVVNVEGSLLASGGNAVDVLEVSPGLMVSEDGNISLAGKDGVLVYIDGRATHLSGTDLLGVLENLSSDELSQIEIMSNPPASYDASGNAGVINIKTRKSKLKGYNGSISLNYLQGRYAHYNSSASFNYRNQNFNLFGTVSYSDRTSFNDVELLSNIRSLGTNELQTILNQSAGHVGRTRDLSTKLGIDYYLGENTVLGLTGKLGRLREDSDVENQIQLSNPNKEVTQTLVAPYTTEYIGKDMDLSLNFRTTFDSTNHGVQVDLGYVIYDDEQNHFYDNSFYDGTLDPGETPFLREDSKLNWPEKFEIYSGQLDYFRPIFNGATLELGAKSSYVEMDILLDFFNLEGGTYIKDPALSNHFLYSENTNAVYGNVGFDITSKLSAQAGLRVEHNIAKGDQLVRDIQFKRERTRWFPTAYLGYNINDDHDVQLSYGRRIVRPSYENVDPYRLYIDEYTYYEGNVKLLPQISSNFELGYLGFGGMLSATAYYNYIDDVIMSSIRQDPLTNETVNQPQNIAESHVYGFDINADIEVTNFLTTTLYFNYYNKRIEGNTNDLPFSIEGDVIDTRIINKFNFSDNWSAILAGFYATRDISGTYLREPYGKINVIVQKKFMDNRAALRFSVSDVFGWNRSVESSRFQNIDIDREVDFQAQYIRLAFSYKFSQGKLKRRKSRNSSNEEEKDRI